MNKEGFSDRVLSKNKTKALNKLRYVFIFFLAITFIFLPTSLNTPSPASAGYVIQPPPFTPPPPSEGTAPDTAPVPITPPPPLHEGRKLITGGSIWGKVYQEGQWASDFTTMARRGKVYLFRKDNNEFKLMGEVRKDLSHYPVEGGHTYNRMTLAKEFPIGGLFEGTYRLAFMHTEAADPLTGDALGSAWLQWAGKAEFIGEVTFELVAYPAGHVNFGYGQIIFIENAGENEQRSAKSTNITSAENGIHLDVKEDSENVFHTVMRNVILFFMEFVKGSLERITTAINNLLTAGNEIEDATGVQESWKNVRDIALSLLTLLLILVAFANILSINLEQYGLGKMIPKIIISIILTYFSLIIALFLLDLVSGLQALLVTKAGEGLFQLSQQTNNTLEFTIGDGASAIAEALFLAIMGFLILIAGLCLLLLLLVRNAMLIILVAVAPLAFLCNILPFTEKYYKQWWASFWKWAFMGPAVLFLLWLSGNFIEAYYAAKFGGEEAATGEGWTFLITSAVMIWLAVTLPLRWGGEIYGAIQNIGNRAGRFVGRKTGISGALADRRASIEARDKERGKRLRSRIALSGRGANSSLRRFVSGVDADQARELDSEIINDMVKNHENQNMTRDEARTSYLTATGNERRALARLQSKNGWFDDGNSAALARMVEDFRNDNYIRNNLPKEQPDVIAAAEIAGLTTGDENEAINSASRTLRAKALTSIENIRPVHVSQMMRPENQHELSELFRSPEKIKTASTKASDQTLAALGRGFKGLDIQTRSEVINNATEEQRAIIQRMADLDTRRSATHNNPNTETLNVLHRIDGNEVQ